MYWKKDNRVRYGLLVCDAVFGVDGRGDTFFRNVDKHLQVYKAHNMGTKVALRIHVFTAVRTSQLIRAVQFMTKSSKDVAASSFMQNSGQIYNFTFAFLQTRCDQRMNVASARPT